MGIISKNKEKLISLLKYLNNKPGFRRLFYWIHEIRADTFEPTKFLAILMDDGFLFGTYNFRKAQLWKRIVTATFEEDEYRVIKEMIPSCDAFIDIGAHIGYYSCLANAVKPGIFTMAFEPNPENYRNLKENFKINHIDPTHCYKLGIGDKQQKLTLYGKDAGGTVNTGSYASEPDEKQTVEITTLSNYRKFFKEYKNVFIKMDVEAFEYQALTGASDFIKEIKPVGFLIEISKHWSGGVNPNFEKIFALMKQYGYRAYRVEDTKNEIEDVSKLDGANYVFKRK